MKNISKLGIVLGAIILTGCSTKPLYEPNQYDTGDFYSDFYAGEVAHEVKEEGEVLKSGQLEVGCYFNGGLADSITSPWTAQGVKDMYPDLYTYTNEAGQKVQYKSADSAANTLHSGSRTDSFCKDNALAYIHDGFRTGVLSKLYNGQSHCMAWYADARVQCDNRGLSTYLPITMSDGDFFYFSLRGNTNDTNPSYPPMFATTDLILRLYVANLDYYEITLKGVRFGINSGLSSQCTLVGGSIKSALGEAVNNIIAYGVSFQRPAGGYFYETEGASSIEEEYTFNLEEEHKEKYLSFSLYEASFLDATWGS